MNKQVSKFLEFNGKTLVFIAVDGQYWIALKPICEALNVHYKNAHSRLQTDPIYAELSSFERIVAADGKLREMVCLPEEWIYGWIMKLQSNSPELIQYQKECHKVLFNHFHGKITGRKELFNQKAKAQLSIDEVMNSLTPDNILKIQRSNKVINQINTKLRALDGDVINEERNLFKN